MREVSTSTYVSCMGMHVSINTHVNKEGFLLGIFFFFFRSHATSCILFSQLSSTLLPFPLFSPETGGTRPALLVSVEHSFR